MQKASYLDEAVGKDGKTVTQKPEWPRDISVGEYDLGPANLDSGPQDRTG